MTASVCPKEMVHGPCGGVRPDLGCEVDGRPCPFVGPGVYCSTPRRSACRFPSPTARAPTVSASMNLCWWSTSAPTGWPGDYAVDVCGPGAAGHRPAPRRARRQPHRPRRRRPAEPARGRRHPARRRRATDLHRDGSRASFAPRGPPPSWPAGATPGAWAVHCVTGDHPRALGIERTTRLRGRIDEPRRGSTIRGRRSERRRVPGEPRAASGAPRGQGPCRCGAVHLEPLRRRRCSGALRRRGADRRCHAADRRGGGDGGRLRGGVRPCRVPRSHAARGPSRRSSRPPIPSRARWGWSPTSCGSSPPPDGSPASTSGGTTRTDPWRRLELTERFVTCVRAAWAEGCAAPTGR